jgi:hypothetical protein
MTTVQAQPGAQLLSAPFLVAEIQSKPKKVNGNRALAIAYVDARAIQDRLDDVLDVDGWRDQYREFAGGSVVCRLRLKIGGQWIGNSDVGSPSEQSDAGDRTKAAFSDALKRAAVKSTMDSGPTVMALYLGYAICLILHRRALAAGQLMTGGPGHAPPLLWPLHLPCYRSITRLLRVCGKMGRENAGLRLSRFRCDVPC